MRDIPTGSRCNATAVSDTDPPLPPALFSLNAQALIISQGALEPLNRQVALGNINAIGTLRRLAETEQNAVFVVESGSTPPLVKLYQTGTELQRDAAAACLKVRRTLRPRTPEAML